jgi:hypothetical protein
MQSQKYLNASSLQDYDLVRMKRPSLYVVECNNNRKYKAVEKDVGSPDVVLMNAGTNAKICGFHS